MIWFVNIFSLFKLILIRSFDPVLLLQNWWVLWHNNTELFGETLKGIIDVIEDVELRLKMVLSLLFVYYDSSQSKLTIRAIIFVNLLSNSVVRVHTNHGRSNSNAHVLKLPPILHPLIIFSLQRLIHLDYWV